MMVGDAEEAGELCVRVVHVQYRGDLQLSK